MGSEPSVPEASPNKALRVCPSCSGTDVIHPGGWNRAGLSLAGACGLATLISYNLMNAAKREAQAALGIHVYNPFMQQPEITEQQMNAAGAAAATPYYPWILLSAGFGLTLILVMFLQARFGSYACNTCGHRWKPAR